MTKSAREIMEILESFDLTRCHWSAGHLAGCDPKTVARYVARRDAGADPHVHARRSRIIDPFLEKIEELVERSNAVVRADKIHERLLALGFAGDERPLAGRWPRPRPPMPPATAALPALGARAGDVAAAARQARRGRQTLRYVPR